MQSMKADRNIEEEEEEGSWEDAAVAKGLCPDVQVQSQGCSQWDPEAR